MPKMTIPSPSSLHFRYGRDAVPVDIYPDMDDFYRDLGEAYRKAVRAFSDAGCRYLQLDEVNFTYLCDPKLRAFVANRGEDRETFRMSIPHDQRRAFDVAPDMTRAMHLCRGNFHATFVASGGYEPVAKILFNEINIDAYFMEYDSDRAGGFAPLRFVPKGQMVVLGLVTSKSGALESKDELKRRIDQAARFIDLDQLCLAAMRLRLHRGGQYPGRGRAMGEAAADRRGCRRGVGMTALVMPGVVPRKRGPMVPDITASGTWMPASRA